MFIIKYIYKRFFIFSKKISFYEFYGFFIKETRNKKKNLTAKEKNIKEILTEIMNSLKKKNRNNELKWNET